MTKFNKTGYFQMIIFIILLLCLTGCGGSSYMFPDDNEIWNTRQKTYGTGRLTAKDHIDFDFYVQATSYMAGFVSADNSIYSMILAMASSTADQWASSKHYYRFDVKNYDTNNGFEPYSISPSQFEQQALADKSFYSVSWYFEQDGRNKDLYREYYGELLDSDPDGIYDSVGSYLFNTLDYLNPDNVSVVFTDLVDSNFETDKAFDWIAKYVADNPDKAVSILAFRSPFNGSVYTGERAFTYEDNERPFYILVLGNVCNVEEYRIALESELSDSGILSHPIDSILLSAKKSNSPAMNYANQTDIIDSSVSTPYDGLMLSKSLLIKLNKQNSNKLLVGSDKDFVKLGDSLCYEINADYSEIEKGEINFLVPLYGFEFWKTDANLAFELETELNVSDKNEDGEYTWTKGNGNSVDTSKFSAGSTVSLSNDGSNLNLKLMIDKDILKDMAPLDKNNSFRISMKVKNNLVINQPDWLNNYFYDGAYSKITDKSYFGYYTISSTRGAFSSSVRAAGDHNNDSNVVADILLYIKY